MENLPGERPRSCGLQEELLGTETEEFFPALYFSVFQEMQRVFYVDAKVPDRALDFGVAKQTLHGAQVAADGVILPTDPGE